MTSLFAASRQGVIQLSPEAEVHLDGLLAYYERLQRPEAARNLLAALERVGAKLERAAVEGLAAPRPYPTLAQLGFRWVKEGA